MLKQGLRERSDTGTVWVARAGARIGVIGGKGKGGYGHRLPVFIPHIDMNVNLLSSKGFQTAQGYKDVGQTKDVRGQGKCNSSLPLTCCSTAIT